METKTLILFAVIAGWLLITAVVVGYPLLKGQMKVGLDPVSRETDPQKFWTAYLTSTALFLGFSVAVGFFVRAILP
jgi:hypothetical protein